MEANTSSVVEPVGEPDLETTVFFDRGDALFYRDAETARVFRIDINYRQLARSLASEADDVDGAAADVAGVAKYREVSRGAIEGVAPLTESAIDPLISDDLHELADEIEAHIEAHPLPRPVDVQ